MSRATVIVDADTAAFERKIAVSRNSLKQMTQPIGAALGPAGALLGRISGIGAAVGLATAAWSGFQRELQRADAGADVLIDKVGRIAAGFGMGRQRADVRGIATSVAPMFGGLEEASAAMEAYTGARPSGASLDELSAAMTATGRASQAGLDAQGFARVMGAMQEMGYDTQRAADAAAQAAQAGAQGVAVTLQLLNRFAAEAPQRMQTPAGFERFLSRVQGSGRSGQTLAALRQSLFQPGGLSEAFEAAVADEPTRLDIDRRADIGRGGVRAALAGMEEQRMRERTAVDSLFAEGRYIKGGATATLYAATRFLGLDALTSAQELRQMAMPPTRNRNTTRDEDQAARD